MESVCGERRCPTRTPLKGLVSGVSVNECVSRNTRRSGVRRVQADVGRPFRKITASSLQLATRAPGSIGMLHEIRWMYSVQDLRAAQETGDKVG